MSKASSNPLGTGRRRSTKSLFSSGIDLTRRSSNELMIDVRVHALVCVSLQRLSRYPNFNSACLCVLCVLLCGKWFGKRSNRRKAETRRDTQRIFQTRRQSKIGVCFFAGGAMLHAREDTVDADLASMARPAPSDFLLRAGSSLLPHQ